jgi:Cell wall-associated hydrolases (invasion-associated proteins)
LLIAIKKIISGTMNFPTYRGLPFCKAPTKLIVPQVMRLSVFFMLVCLLSFTSGCATRDSTYSPQSSLSRSPYSNVQVATAKSANNFQHNNVVRAAEQHSNVVTTAKSAIGIPYRFGGSSPDTGFDCSGLVAWSYEQMGVRLPRLAKDQLYSGSKVLAKSELQAGDIVVFKGTNSPSGWHSGIYAGNGNFVHSPRTGKHVTVSSLEDNYFARRFVGGTRVLPDSGGLIYASYAPASQTLAQRNAAYPAYREEALQEEAVQYEAPVIREKSTAIKVMATSVKGKSGQQPSQAISKSKNAKKAETVAAAKAKAKTEKTKAVKGKAAGKTMASAKGKTQTKSLVASNGGKQNKNAASAKSKSVQSSKAAGSGKSAKATSKTTASAPKAQKQKKAVASPTLKKQAPAKKQASNSSAKRKLHSDADNGRMKKI